MNFLEQIRDRKLREIATLRAGPTPVRAADDPVRPFAAALRGSGGIIAEVKGTSPSHPEFRKRAAPADLAVWYERGGAVAMSVVTDQAAFGTSLDDLAAMRRASPLPVISKDFISDEIQIRTAWAAGADAVLLIARLLTAGQLAGFLALARELGLDALVECHDAEDIRRSLAAGAGLLGINNRDLASLTTDIRRTEELLPLVPKDVVRVSESGLQHRADIARLAARGVDAFLVGHALLLSGDPGRKLRELSGREAEAKVRVKICGVTTPEDAVLCHNEGADLLGVIFAASPRRIDRDRARAIRAAVPDARLVGVFVDEDPGIIAALARDCGLDLVQLHGHETAGYCRELAASTGLPLIKAVTPSQVRPDIVRQYEAVKYFLLDQPKIGDGARCGDSDGWCRAADSLTDQGAELMLAGGLDGATAGELAADLRPFAVDICRAVEAEPGRKDPRRVRSFLQEVIR